MWYRFCMNHVIKTANTNNDSKIFRNDPGREFSNGPKACLQLQRRFAYVGHAMALVMQKKYGIKDFCGYVELASSLEFLKSQKEINYSRLLYDAELKDGHKTEKLDLDYLKFLEKEYGLPNLWPYIEIDRVIRHGLFLREYPHNASPFTHEEMMRILQSSAKKIIAFLEKESPDFILFSAINGINSLLLFHIAKKKNIKTFFIQTARVGNKYTLTDDYRGLSFIEKTFGDLDAKKISLPNERAQALKFLEEFRKKPVSHSPTQTSQARPVSRSRQFKFLLPHKLFNSVYWLAKNSADYFRYGKKDYYPKPWHWLLDRAKRKIRVLIGFEKFYDELDPKENSAFFPLHFEPEMSISLFAPYYKDQLWLIKQIARSLPINYKLYVKEHPVMFGYRPRSFYRELKKITNVKLLKPTLTSFELLNCAKIVFSISGTAAWEGALLKKPAVIFGDAFFSVLPMVKICRAITDLPYLIKEQLEKFKYDEEALVNLLTAIFGESADMDLIKIWDIEGGANMEGKEKEVSSFVDLLASKLGLNKPF